MKWSNEFRSTPRMVMPLGLSASSMPQNFSLGECRLTTTIELSSIVAGWKWLDDFTAGEPVWAMRVGSERHGGGAVWRKEEFGLGEGLDLFESGVGGKLAEQEAFGRD